MLASALDQQMHVVRSWVTTQDDAVRCGLGLDLPVPAPVVRNPL